MRIALVVEYNGQGFYGWQTQANLPTIQGCLEDALQKVAMLPVAIYCAGRTDAFVHATHQVVHFDAPCERPLRAWTLGTNTHLPPGIVVRAGIEVDDEFHARFSALSRCYRYIIYNHPIRPAILNGKVTWHKIFLDADKMHTAAQYFLGENDFSSFRSSQCESKTPMRNIQEIKVLRKDHYVILEVKANAFLHHMVRNLVGVLIQIGEGNHPPEWAKEVLLAKNRTKAAITADPFGLYLIDVAYPEQFNIPQKVNFIL